MKRGCNSYPRLSMLFHLFRNKIMDFNSSQIETIKLEPSSTLSYGEVPVYYSTDKVEFPSF